jgi:hypothetical protein
MLLLLGCAVDEKPTETIPDLPTSTCGEPYAWLPLERVGGVLEWEEMEEWSLDADTIRALLEVAGVEDTSVVRYGARVVRARYLTQDRGEQAEATAIFAVPDADVEAVSVLYMHPTTGFEDFCAPSGRDLTAASVPIAFAGMGYAVAAPDYLGQNGFGEEAEARHPYLGAEPTAIASLDALRALWGSSSEWGATPSRRTLIVGASQGGGGALWAERYAAAYLPEAELIGNVMAVPVLDLVGWAEAAATELTVASIGVPFALDTLADWYGLDADLGEVVPADQLARVEETMDTECPSASVPDDITTLDQVYTSAWRDALATGDLDAWAPWSCMLADGTVGLAPVGRTADVPALVLLGSEDDVSLDDVQAAAVDALCAEGHEVEAFRCDGLGHTDTVLATIDEIVAWMGARAAGEPMGQTCAGVAARTCE